MRHPSCPHCAGTTVKQMPAPRRKRGRPISPATAFKMVNRWKCAGCAARFR